MVFVMRAADLAPKALCPGRNVFPRTMSVAIAVILNESS